MFPRAYFTGTYFNDRYFPPVIGAGNQYSFNIYDILISHDSLAHIAFWNELPAISASSQDLPAHAIDMRELAAALTSSQDSPAHVMDLSEQHATLVIAGDSIAHVVDADEFAATLAVSSDALIQSIGIYQPFYISVSSQDLVGSNLFLNASIIDVSSIPSEYVDHVQSHNGVNYDAIVGVDNLHHVISYANNIVSSINIVDNASHIQNYITHVASNILGIDYVNHVTIHNLYDYIDSIDMAIGSQSIRFSGSDIAYVADGAIHTQAFANLTSDSVISIDFIIGGVATTYAVSDGIYTADSSYASLDFNFVQSVSAQSVDNAGSYIAFNGNVKVVVMALDSQIETQYHYSLIIDPVSSVDTVTPAVNIVSSTLDQIGSTDAGIDSIALGEILADTIASSDVMSAVMDYINGISVNANTADAVVHLQGMINAGFDVMVSVDAVLSVADIVSDVVDTGVATDIVYAVSDNDGRFSGIVERHSRVVQPPRSVLQAKGDQYTLGSSNDAPAISRSRSDGNFITLRSDSVKISSKTGSTLLRTSRESPATIDVSNKPSTVSISTKVDAEVHVVGDDTKIKIKD
jgi:hypothetical protein